MAALGGFSFGAKPTAATSTSASTGLLGASAGGFSFGNQGAAKTTPLIGGIGDFTSNLSSSSTSTPQSTSGLKFGQTPTTGSSLLGKPNTTASSSLSAGGFKLGGQPSSGLNLSTGLGTKAIGQAAPTLKLGALGTTTTTAAPATSFSFGAKPTSTGLTLGGAANTLGGSSLSTTGTVGLSLGTKPIQGGLGTGFGLGGATSTLAASTVSKGLGGVDPASLKPTTASINSGSTNTSNSKAVKETSLPPEIGATVAEFKEYVKKQKAIREELGRFSSKPMHKVKGETLALRQLLSVVSNSLQRNTMAIYKLKVDSAQELKNAEMAHRTHDIPRALQMENTAPDECFQRLIQHFEEQMQLCHQEIEQIESHLMSLSRPAGYTPHELSLIMIKMNDTFISLAAKLQTVHEAVKSQKEQYLNYRRVYHDDNQDVFAVRRRQAEKQSKIAVVPTGPGPFHNISNATAIAMAAALQYAQKPTGLPTGGIGFGLGAGGTALAGGVGTGFGGGTGLFGSTNTGLGTVGLGAGGSMIRPLGTQTTGGFGTSFGTAAKTGFATGSSFGTGTGFGKGAGSSFGSSGTSFGTSSLTLGSGLPSSNKPNNISLGGSLSAGPTSTGFSAFGSSAGKKRGF